MNSHLPPENSNSSNKSPIAEEMDHYKQVEAVRNASWKAGIVFTLFGCSLIEMLSERNFPTLFLSLFLGLLFVVAHNRSGKAFFTAIGKSAPSPAEFFESNSPPSTSSE